MIEKIPLFCSFAREVAGSLAAIQGAMARFTAKPTLEDLPAVFKPLDDFRGILWRYADLGVGLSYFEALSRGGLLPLEEPLRQLSEGLQKAVALARATPGVAEGDPLTKDVLARTEALEAAVKASLAVPVSPPPSLRMN